MQVFDSLLDIPPWLIIAFGVTNITQGILGYYTTLLLYERKKYQLMHLNWMAGYFCMFFILLYGWDGTGLDRFLYDRDMFNGIAWTVGAGFQEGAAWNIFLSTVAITLYIDGFILLPPYFYLYSKWKCEAQQYTTIGAIGQLLFRVFVLCFGLAALLAGLTKVTFS